MFCKNITIVTSEIIPSLNEYNHTKRVFFCPIESSNRVDETGSRGRSVPSGPLSPHVPYTLFTKYTSKTTNKYFTLIMDAFLKCGKLSTCYICLFCGVHEGRKISSKLLRFLYHNILWPKVFLLNILNFLYPFPWVIITKPCVVHSWTPNNTSFHIIMHDCVRSTFKISSYISLIGPEFSALY